MILLNIIKFDSKYTVGLHYFNGHLLLLGLEGNILKVLFENRNWFIKIRIYNKEERPINLKWS